MHSAFFISVTNRYLKFEYIKISKNTSWLKKIAKKSTLIKDITNL